MRSATSSESNWWVGVFVELVHCPDDEVDEWNELIYSVQQRNGTNNHFPSFSSKEQPTSRLGHYLFINKCISMISIIKVNSIPNVVNY